MANGYSRSPVLLKGALIRFDAPRLIPIPNIIIFQYNPETLARALTPYTPPALDESSRPATTTGSSAATAAADGRAQPYDPQESFSVRLILDASDALETPESHPVAVATGVADRLAALEMLLYPITEGVQLLGSIASSLGVAATGATAGISSADAVPERNVPVTLFVWGPGRIVPVRLTSFTVEEQQFSPLLYPTRATVAVSMTVLQPHVFQRGNLPLRPEEELAKGAYQFTYTQKQLLATANLVNSAESVVGMLPF